MTSQVAAREDLAVLDAIEDPIFVMEVEPGPVYRCRFVNAAYEAVTGFQRHALVGRSPREVLPAKEAGYVERRYAEATAARRAIRYEETATTPAGTVHVLTTLTPIFESSGRCTLVGLLRDVTDRVRLEERLRRSNEAFARAQRIARVGSWDWDVVGNRLEWSEELYRIFGIDPARFTASYEAFLARVHPEDRGEVERAVEKALRQGAPYDVDHRIVLDDGTVRIVHEQAEVVRDGAGNPTSMVGTARDVTEERRASDALRLAESALDAATIAVAIGDMEGKVTYANHALARLWGFGRREELIGQPIPNFWTDPEAARAAVEAVGRDGRSVGELEAIRRDGRRLLLRVTSNLFTGGDGAPMRTMATFDDVTELHATRDHLVAAQRLAGLGTWSVDLRTGRLELSEEAGRLLGVDPGGSAHSVETILDRFRPADREAAAGALRRAASGGDPTGLDLRVALPDGRERVVYSQSRLLRDAAGKPSELRGVLQDVTARVSMEEQLRQSQKMEAVGKLAAGVAHDFNNLLTVIRSCAEILAGAFPAGSPRASHVGDIALAADRAADLVRQLLAFGRRQQLDPRVVDLDDAVEGFTPMLRRVIRENVRIELGLARSGMAVRVDPGQLGQVLMNLAANARDAMPGGGRLAIETRRERVGEGLAASQGVAAGPFAVLRVRDSGTGIPPEALPHVFEPFYTSKIAGRGTGLGLATVDGIARQSGGFVRASSDPGQGACFEVFLPEVAAAPVAPAASAAPPPAAGRGETVLVVEDDPAVRSVVELTLRQQGFTVVAVSGREEAHLALDRLSRPPDLVLTDVVMPGGSGVLLAEELSRRGVSSVLFMSGYSDEVLSGDGLVHPGVNLVPKPFTPSELLRHVQAALAAR
ncbi:MAG TPA: PAS domain S-box protein [Anaeromyxobacteraceae bacterium]|nr:PAS domain S-box protein [Anaeromyxobacteraceae bacterium]